MRHERFRHPVPLPGAGAGHRRARLHHDDPGAGAEPAADPGRQRRHRAGAHRQRQDRRVRPGPAAQAGSGADPRAGAGAVPDPRTGRPGRQAAAQAGHRHSKHETGGADRRHAAWPAAGLAGGARPAGGGRHARAHPGTGAQARAAPGRGAHAGTGRGRPHARHGLRRADPRDRQPLRQAPPEPAVFGHLPRCDPHPGARAAARTGRGDHRRRRQRAGDRAAVLRSRSELPAESRGGAAAALHPRIQRGVLQYPQGGR